MPKYKVGDVAALFPKPKKPTTETQKKLQSLFEEFNNLKKESSKKFANGKKKKRPAMHENTKDQNQRSPIKKKKRKFSELRSSEPSILSGDKKKFKHTNEQEFAKTIEMKKNIDSEDRDFPRRKKTKLNTNNLNKSIVDSSNVIDSFSKNDQVMSSGGINANTECNKQVLGFIKKSKHQIFGSKKMSKRINNDISLTENTQEVPKKKSFAFHDDTDLFKSGNKEVAKKSSKKQNKKSSSSNGIMSTFELEVQKAEPDFIKLKSNPIDEEEVLSRTLFVGNLPVNTTRKDITKLFSVFGPIDVVRYRPIETNRNKIFKKGGPKVQNMNYAAESIPGFVVFKERQHAVDALSLSGSVFQSHHITVDFAMPPGSKKLYDEKRSIFIGNLPFDTKDESVWNAFAECGKIEGVRVVKDRETGIGKGFGYVLFNSVQGKVNALALEDLEIQGRKIRIKAVDSNKKTQKKTESAPVKRDSFKSRAIKYKKDHKDSGSRKSVKKIMKKNKDLHEKKKIASLLQKSMK